MKHYLGFNPLNGEYEHFTSDVEPTQTTHGHLYSLVWGPWRTKRAAELAQKYWRGNPHTTTVAAVERIAKAEAQNETQ